MNTECNIKSVMTLKGKTHFLIYSGSEHKIAENLDELKEFVSGWATRMTDSNHKDMARYKEMKK
mgnify:CR=1 FL=1